MLIDKHIRNQIIQYSEENRNAEILGAVVNVDGKQEFRRIHNLSAVPVVEYVADPQGMYDQLKDTKLFFGQNEIVCFVHSHQGSPQPSTKDLFHAYRKFPYLVYSLREKNFKAFEVV